MLVISPTAHILRGFIVEPTSSKNIVNVWRVVLPLYLQGAHFNLSYGNGLRRILVDPTDYKESAERIYELIESHIDELRGIYHPVDFLEFFLAGGGTHRGVWSDFDLALTHYMVGDHRLAIELLHAFDAQVAALPAAYTHYTAPVIRRVLHELDTNPLGLMPLLQEWEDAKVEALGLPPSRVGIAT